MTAVFHYHENDVRYNIVSDRNELVIEVARKDQCYECRIDSNICKDFYGASAKNMARQIVESIMDKSIKICVSNQILYLSYTIFETVPTQIVLTLTCSEELIRVPKYQLHFDHKGEDLLLIVLHTRTEVEYIVRIDQDDLKTNKYINTFDIIKSMILDGDYEIDVSCGSMQVIFEVETPYFGEQVAYQAMREPLDDEKITDIINLIC